MSSPALDLNAAFRNPGAGASRPPFTLGEPVELTQLELDRAEAEAGARTAPLMRLRWSHHRLAQSLAQGMREFEASAVTGYAPGTISGLKRDPAFQELIAHYRERMQEQVLDQVGRMAAISADALEVLHERILESPEKMTNDALLRVAQLTLDRSGHGPTSTVRSATLTIDSRDLLALKGESSSLVSILPRRSPRQEALLAQNDLRVDVGGLVGEASDGSVGES